MDLIGSTNATQRPPLHTHPAAAAGENSKLNSCSSASTANAISARVSVPAVNSVAVSNGPEQPNGCKRLKKWHFDRSLFKNVRFIPLNLMI